MYWTFKLSFVADILDFFFFAFRLFGLLFEKWGIFWSPCSLSYFRGLPSQTFPVVMTMNRNVNRSELSIFSQRNLSDSFFMEC